MIHEKKFLGQYSTWIRCKHLWGYKTNFLPVYLIKMLERCRKSVSQFHHLGRTELSNKSNQKVVWERGVLLRLFDIAVFLPYLPTAIWLSAPKFWFQIWNICNLNLFIFASTHPHDAREENEIYDQYGTRRSFEYPI